MCHNTTANCHPPTHKWNSILKASSAEVPTYTCACQLPQQSMAAARLFTK